MLLTPLRADPRAALAGANPLAKLGAAAIVMLVLFLSVDPVTPLALLCGIAVAVWLSAIPPRALLGRCAPLLVAALGASIVNGVFGGGGPSLVAGIATGLRLIAIALAGIVAFVTIDPTDLADALIQHLHAPPRFAVGALAPFRLLPIFATDILHVGPIGLGLMRTAPSVGRFGQPAGVQRRRFRDRRHHTRNRRKLNDDDIRIGARLLSGRLDLAARCEPAARRRIPRPDPRPRQGVPVHRGRRLPGR